jgi:hypothetical protein
MAAPHYNKPSTLLQLRNDCLTRPCECRGSAGDPPAAFGDSPKASPLLNPAPHSGERTRRRVPSATPPSLTSVSRFSDARPAISILHPPFSILALVACPPSSILHSPSSLWLRLAALGFLPKLPPSPRPQISPTSAAPGKPPACACPPPTRRRSPSHSRRRQHNQNNTSGCHYRRRRPLGSNHGGEGNRASQGHSQPPFPAAISTCPPNRLKPAKPPSTEWPPVKRLNLTASCSRANFLRDVGIRR